MLRNVWTDDRITDLRQLWNDGYSAAIIAQRLGITRNAVIGKSHRLDLPMRKTLVSRERKRDARPSYSQRIERRLAVKRSGNGHHTYIHKRKSQDAPVVVAKVDFPEPVSLDLTIMDLKPGLCKWAHGDGPFLFCGAPTEGHSYCPHHYDRTVQPAWRTQAMRRRDDRLARF